MKNFKNDIANILNDLAHVGVISDEAMVAVAGLMSSEFDAWRAEVASELRDRIKNWEAIEGDDPVMNKAGSLYTLGLRQALDLVLDQHPLDEPPVLETDAEVEIGNEPPDEDG